MSNILKEMRDTLDELICMHQLNFELLEQLNVACKWLLENETHAPNRANFVSLLNKVDALITEIDSRPTPEDAIESIRRKFTDKQNRRRLDSTLFRRIYKIVYEKAGTLP